MEQISRRAFLAVTGAAAAAASCSTPTDLISTQTSSLQDTSPSRPIRLIVPAPAGHRTDAVGRLVAAALEKHLGEPVGVINPEGTSAVAHAAIATAPPDGRTLGLVTVDIASMHWRGMSQHSYRDYTPLALVGEDPAAIHVKTDGRWQNAKDLMEHIRANPGALKVSGVARGGIWHLSTVGWLTAAGLSAEAMPWVAANGPPAALQDLAAGSVDVVVCSVPEVRATPDAKATRTLAVMARQRNPRYPEVPTLHEAIGLRYAAGAWRGVAGPKNLPSATATRLAAALRKTWDSAEFRGSMKRRGFRPVWNSAQEFAAFMEAEDKRMAATVQAAGMAKT